MSGGLAVAGTKDQRLLRHRFRTKSSCLALDGFRQFRARPAAIGGDLPQVIGIGAAGFCQGGSSWHVADVGQKVHWILSSVVLDIVLPAQPSVKHFARPFASSPSLGFSA